MLAVEIRATAVLWVSDDFPGWIEAVVLDCRRQGHRILDKVPVLTPSTVTRDSPFPVEFWTSGETAAINGDEVVVSFSDGVHRS